MRKVLFVSVLVSLAGGVGVWISSAQFATGLAVAILIVLLSTSIIGLICMDQLIGALVDRHPVETVLILGFACIPGGGAAIAWVLQKYGARIAQGSDQFAVLAEVIVVLLVALSVEVATAPRAGDVSPRERGALIAGLGLGAVVGLAGSVWGALHPAPGLLFVGTAAMSALMLGALVAVAIPLQQAFGYSTK
jgi:hypothetical protein